MIFSNDIYFWPGDMTWVIQPPMNCYDNNEKILMI